MFRHITSFSLVYLSDVQEGRYAAEIFAAKTENKYVCRLKLYREYLLSLGFPQKAHIGG